jgi:RNA polymerase sigma-70 factor (ECF subfamily)
MASLKTTNLQTEPELVALLQKGSMTAFEELFGQYSQKLYNFSHSYLKSESESEDIVQEVFLKIWENRSKIKTGTSFQSYLFTIAFNSIKKSFNKKNRQDKFRTDLFNFLSAENTTLENHPNYEMLLSKLDAAIDQMPERRKEIFLLRKKDGIPVHDIAEKMNISSKTVENQITEAMNYLKREFGKDQISGMLFFYIFLE